MEIQAFERSLRALAKRSPFQPFSVEFVSGEVIDIEHPEALVFRNAVAVFFAPDGELVLFDHRSVSRFISTTGQAASA